MSSFLAKGKKTDLFKLAFEINESVNSDLKVIELRNIIVKSKAYQEDPDFVKALFEGIISERIEDEEKSQKQEQLNRDFELQKLRLQIENQKILDTNLTHESNFKVDIQKVLPIFNPDIDDINVYLLLFERQMKIFKIPNEVWVTHLIGVLPSEISQLLAREPEELFQDYQHIRAVLLQRFKMTAEKFRKLFSQTRKPPATTWKDYFFELRTYFEGWLSELKINDFESLKNLIISDQLKKRCNPECREHFLDEWEAFTSPIELVDKLDTHDNLRNPITKSPKKTYLSSRESTAFRKQIPQKKEVSDGETSRIPSEDKEPTISCYGCGTPGFIKSKCPNCSSTKQEENYSSVKMFTCLTSDPLPLIGISLYGIPGAVCVDTGASRSIGSDFMLKVLKERGQTFNDCHISMSLANGQRTLSKVLTADVPIKVHGNEYLLNMIFLPNAKENRTLLGVDFLRKSGIVVDIQRQLWHFNDKPHRKYRFAKDVMKTNTRAENDEHNSCLIKKNSNFTPGGGATPFIKNYINTANHPPLSATPHRLSSQKALGPLNSNPTWHNHASNRVSEQSRCFDRRQSTSYIQRKPPQQETFPNRVKANYCAFEYVPCFSRSRNLNNFGVDMNFFTASKKRPSSHPVQLVQTKLSPVIVPRNQMLNCAINNQSLFLFPCRDVVGNRGGVCNEDIYGQMAARVL